MRAMVNSGRLLQFASVGLIGTAMDFAVLYLLVESGDTALEVAKLVSAETAIVVMFIANEYWTFSEMGRAGYRPLLRRLLISNLVRAVGLVVATVVLSLLVRYLGIPYLVANVVGIGCGFFVNFFAESCFTWQVHT